MKKSSILFLLFFAAALPAFSASTCETRVDKHQDATTLERVSYCLTPEVEPPAAVSGAELVYYGVSGKAPQEETERDARYRQKYFDKDGVAVSQGYVDTRKFPAFTNDTLSEQERLALEKAEKEAWEKAQAEEEKKAATLRAPLRTPSVLTETEPEMTKAQLAARKNKPNRFMKEAAPQQPAEPEAQAYSYDTPDTPSGEIAQAQAWENNPLEPSAGNAGGAAPNGFFDDNLLDDPSFGYNATDPAMMP